MPIERRLRGSGITAKEENRITEPSGAADDAELRRMVGHAISASTGWIGSTEAQARRILEAAGVTDRRKLPEDSEEDFARRILDQIETLRVVIDRGVSELLDAVRFAVELGVLAERARMKFRWEPDALRGRRNWETLNEQRKKGNSKAIQKAASQRAEWREKTISLRKSHPHLRFDATVAEIIHLELPDSQKKKVKVGTIRKAIRGLK